MTLEMQIKKLQEEMLPMIPADVLTLLLSKTQELVNSGISEKAFKKGDKIPKIILPNALNKTINVNELLNDGPLVISFYRGGWCPYCNLELKELQDKLSEIKSNGGTLIAITPELPDNSLATSEKHKLEFEVLSDVGNKTAKEFGLVFNLAEELRPIYKQFNFDITKYNGDETWSLPIPANYIVNKEGVIAESFVDADYTKKMEPADIIEALKNLQ